MRIALFGEPNVRIDEQPFRFAAPPRALPLFAYLLLNRSAPRNREAVAHLFWSDVPSYEARANLRRHLHYIKCALAPLAPHQTWFDVTKTHVQWNPRSPVTIDVAEFEAASNSPKDRYRAVELYRGDLFERCDEDWIRYERERLHALQRANLESLVVQTSACGASADALAYAARLVAMDPWREDAVRLLMTLRAQNGDRAGALREFKSFRTRLHAELDAEPMPETVELDERLRAYAAPTLPAEMQVSAN